MKNLNDYRDDFGHIGHRDKHGQLEFGDSAQRDATEGIVLYHQEPELREYNAKKFYEKFDRIRRVFNEKKGVRIVYRRHWDGRHWPGKLYNNSVDNFEPVLMCMALYAPYCPHMRALFTEAVRVMWKRLGFVWNWYKLDPKPDEEPKLPGMVRPWHLLGWTIRGKRWWWAYPILLVTDGLLILESLLRIGASIFYKSDTSACLNHINRLLTGQLVYQNPTVWVAKILYAAFRFRAAPGGAPRLEGYAPQTVFNAYYDEDKDPPMDKLVEPTIQKLI